jgi:hypothetical protein
MDALDNLKNLCDKQVAKEITEAAIQMFCDDFEQVEQAIEDHDEEIDCAGSGVETEQMEVSSADLNDQESNKNDKHGKQRGTMFAQYFQRSTAEVRVLLS